jgi:hypothetical protein
MTIFATPHTAALSSDQERQARKNAGAKLGWFIHATVFVAVNIGLALLSGLHGKSWAIFPAFGWGIGLLVHGFVVFFLRGNSGLYQSLLQRERERVAHQGTPR